MLYIVHVRFITYLLFADLFYFIDQKRWFEQEPVGVLHMNIYTSFVSTSWSVTDVVDAMVVEANYRLDDEPREIFFFRWF